MEIDRIVGGNLTRLRVTRRATKASLAAATGLKTKALTAVEMGVRRLGASELYRLCAP